MKIIDKSKDDEMDFGALVLEDVFKYEDRIFMKVSISETEEYNAYDFTKSRLTKFSLETKVSYISSELVLYKRN